MTYTLGQLAPRLRDLADKVAAFDAGDPVPRPLIEPLSAIERWADKHGATEEHARSCMDRIEPQAARNEETYSSMMGWLDAWDKTGNDDKRDAARTRVEESPLSVTRNGDKLTIEESTGGPADGYEVTFDTRTGEIESVRYYFRDWWDGAELDVDPRDYPGTWRYLSYWADAAAEGLIRDENNDDD